VNAWTHLAGTLDGTMVRVYVNGEMVGSQVQTASLVSTTGTLQIGADIFAGEHFAGLIDEVRIYNRALSQAEIQSDMTVAIGGTPPPPTTGLSINPRAATLTFRLTQQFAASSSNVSWSVDGVIGGSASSGTITTTGLYSPPSSVGTHTVRATTSDQSQSASATVYITDYSGKFMHQNDNFRTGANANETVLTPANVMFAIFGKLFSYPLDGIAYASPLYVANVNIPGPGPGQGFHNVVYVATAHDTVYAFDADGRSSTPLWQVSFINPAGGVTTVAAADTGECCDIAPEIGITGTPVIDA